MSEIKAEKKAVEVVRLEMSREVAEHLRDLVGELSREDLEALQSESCDKSITFHQYRTESGLSLAEAIYSALHRAVS